MNDVLLDQMTRNDPTLLVIEGEAKGLYYVASPKNPGQMAILGRKGATIVNREQAESIVKELIEVFDLYNGKSGFQYGEEVLRSEKLAEWRKMRREIFG